MLLESASAPAAPSALARSLAWAASLAGLAAVLWVLYPVFFHAHVRVSPPTAATLAALRTTPEDSTLARIVALPPLGPPMPAGNGALGLADRWLAAARDGDPAQTHPVLTALTTADLSQGHGVGVLSFSSLFQVDVFVHAYRLSGDGRYLATARDLALAYARYERAAWRDHGFLWNDHAIAARVGVIVRFWAAYRGSALFEESAASEILQHVARSAALLAMPAHFTAWSNHGVMQNIALLQVAAAFPALVDPAALARLAIDRLALQLPFYASEEGVVLEHSAGYQEMGHMLLAMAMPLAELNRLPLPQGWAAKLERSDSVLRDMRRPDGTLPPFGDTLVDVPAVPRVAADPAETELRPPQLFPLSGLALWSGVAGDGRPASHSTVTWSYFPGHPHKHADEMSLVVWAAGRGWITPSGYAPYDSDLRTAILGWQGSNAPHAAGEAAASKRQATLLGAAASTLSVLLDMRREWVGGGGFRRQVLQVAGGRWLVIDEPLAPVPGDAMETLWTFMPDLVLESRGGGRYLLRGDAGEAMTVSLLAAAGPPRATEHLASRSPLAGWIATERGMQGAPALRVAAGGRGWTATLFEFGRAPARASLTFDDAEHWRIAAPGWQAARDGARLQVVVDERRADAELRTPRDTAAARESIQQALAAATKAYPKYRNLDEYRLAVAGVLSVAWLVQALALHVALPRMRRRRILPLISGVLLSGWAAGSVWLAMVYFAS